MIYGESLIENVIEDLTVSSLSLPTSFLTRKVDRTFLCSLLSHL